MQDPSCKICGVSLAPKYMKMQDGDAKSYYLNYCDKCFVDMNSSKYKDIVIEKPESLFLFISKVFFMGLWSASIAWMGSLLFFSVIFATFHIDFRNLGITSGVIFIISWVYFIRAGYQEGKPKSPKILSAKAQASIELLTPAKPMSYKEHLAGGIGGRTYSGL